VKTIAVFSEKNPIATVVRFHLGPRCGTAKVSTSIRLAATQTVTAIATMSDGSHWSGDAEVVVTLAACLDGG
jgi:sulfur-oxidizing protein SoxY